MRRSLALASAFLLATLLVTAWHEDHRPEPVALTPTLTGETEYCLTCHGDLPEISASHAVEVFGCVICHGGERLALDADLAHSTLRGGNNPSDLTVVEESCGGSTCHSGTAADDRDHIHRVLTSVQATYAGAIANMRYAFGAQPDLNAYQGVQAVQDLETATGIHSLGAFDPAQERNLTLQTFAQNCLNCHLSAGPLPGGEYARFTGCAACHAPTAGGGQGEGDEAEEKIHTLTTAILYTQCNTCHNRGNYDVRKMAFVPRNDHPTDRIHNYYQPVAQFARCEWTLDCIDCHTRKEVMGDGDLHPNQAAIQYVQCKTCHGTLTALPATKQLTDPDDIAFRLAQLNPFVDLRFGDTVLVTDAGEPLWNTRVLPDGTYTLIGKATGRYFTFQPVMGTQCQQKPDEQESRYCHPCHAVRR
jgi:mono/diheme cytochrome c family protein